MADLDCQVLVVGAGPTGLMAANLLKRSGVDVRIVDERGEASRESRAFAIQARTMELFQHIGVVDALLDRGVVNPGIDLFVSGDRVGGLNYDKAGASDTPYPFIFLLPQSETEAILIADLARQGVAVERETKIAAIEQDGDGVVARGDAPSGAVGIRAAYVVGADGAHSIVRKALGLAFSGDKYAQSFLLADCRVHWPQDRGLDHARFRVFTHGASIGLFLPLDGRKCSRIMATDHSGQADEKGAAAALMDLPELEAAFQEASAMDVRLSDPVWTTRYRVHHRGVDSYRRGRVFVAGDAAHIHSPAGGQGMNTGLQDAANLAWKLAAVLRGAPDALLDTYDAERRPVGRQVVETSDRMFSAFAGETGLRANLRDWIAKPAAKAISNMRSIQHRAFRTLSELDIAYEPNGFGANEASKLGEAAPAVGRRAPNAAISRHRDVFDLTQGYGFTVLALSRKALERDEAERVAAELDTLASSDIGVAPHLVARLAVGRDPSVEFVSSPDVFDRYGLAEDDGQAIYLVRPDGVVAWRADGLDVEGCRRFVERFQTEGTSHG